jgi:hypothetical protein
MAAMNCCIKILSTENGCCPTTFARKADPKTKNLRWDSREFGCKERHSDQNNPIFSEAPASDSSRLGDAVHSASTCPVSGALCQEPGARWCLKGSHHHLLVEKYKVRLKLGEKSGCDSSIFGCWYKRFCRYSATVAD